MPQSRRVREQLNIPDTVGDAIPSEFGAFIHNIIEGVPNVDKAVIKAYRHNDLGLAVANSIMAVRNGARQVEVAVNGLGERAGNASLEEFVMSLKVRQYAQRVQAKKKKRRSLGFNSKRGHGYRVIHPALTHLGIKDCEVRPSGGLTGSAEGAYSLIKFGEVLSRPLRHPG